jgi:hypothetical protein
MNKFYLLLILVSTNLHAQYSSQQIFEFLNMPNSSRLTALGTYNITTKDADIGMALTNPALIDSAYHKALAFNYNFHIAGISGLNLDYGHYIKKFDITTHLNFQRLNYGNFDRTDNVGTVLGTYNASDYVMNIGVGKKLNERFNAGINLKYINSRYDFYTAKGFGIDFGANYYNPKSKIDIALVIKNIGFLTTSYANVDEKLPIDVQFGISKKLAHLPFRISMTARKLNNWNVFYENPFDNQILFIGQDQPETSRTTKFIDNLFRHITIGGEFIFGKSEVFSARFAYNHSLRKELNVNNFRSLTGFSGGFGVKISKFRLD